MLLLRMLSSEQLLEEIITMYRTIPRIKQGRIITITDKDIILL